MFAAPYPEGPSHDRNPVDDTSTVQLRLVAPTQLTSHDNIRADLDLDDAFRASIRRPRRPEPHHRRTRHDRRF